MILRRYLLEASTWTLALTLGSFAAGCGSDPSTSSNGAGSTTSSATGTGPGGGGGGGQGGSGGQGGAGGGACIPETEICDGADNNCDGVVDEGCMCMPGDTQECYTGPAGTKNVGLCVAGTQTCDATGQWGSCTGEVLPENEACDGVDNNCDGMIDDGDPGGGMMCMTGNSGVCADGTTACMNGSVVCNQDVQPSAETCDGLDNDCNGMADDGDPGGGMTCMTGNPGVCADGTTACMNGSVVCNQDVQSSPETCDGLDNDCNGTADDGDPGGGMTCMTGNLGVCADGTTACMNGSVVCNQDVQPSPEMCDGLDNDCNGTADDGNPGGGMACMTGSPGVCAAGTTACMNGSVMCNPDVQPSPEMCDSLDNDCNGMADEGDPGGGMACMTGNPGVCAAGTTACTNGSVVCNQDVQPSPELCDGLDNDCNGTADEGDPGGGMMCDTGNPGACSAGTTSCMNGALACNQNVQPSLEVCDGEDNNCDGTVDEVNSTGPTGTCDHNKCVEGTMLDSTCDSCVAIICAVDAYCCDTAWDSICVDEVLSECNVACTGTCDTGQPGVCGPGAEVCANGSLSCVPDMQASMEVCDGLDNDCDGQIDNGIPGTGVSCNTGQPGVCAAGITACDSFGMIICNPVTQPSADVCGDGLDNNCDGQADAFCNCAHSGCVTGTTLALGCDPCVDVICAVDPYCCNTDWDSVCVGEVSSECNLVCP